MATSSIDFSALTGVEVGRLRYVFELSTREAEDVGGRKE
jgi:hypothetical protein